MLDKKITHIHRSHSVVQLRIGCKDRRLDNSHEAFCLELFRRAITEKCTDSWSAIYEQYQLLICRWAVDYTVHDHDIGPTVVDEIIVDSFANFWQSYTEKKLGRATNLSSILSYLKSCTLSAIIERRRQNQRDMRKAQLEQSAQDRHTSTVENTPILEERILQQIEADYIWRIIQDCCDSEKEYLIAQLSFVANFKPKRIMELHPSTFTDEQEIYQLRRNLKNRLKRNKDLAYFS